MLISFFSDSKNLGVVEGKSPGGCAQTWLLFWTFICSKISPISQCWIKRTLGFLLSTFAPFEKEGIRSRRQHYHLWSTYTVSSTELYIVYITCSSLCYRLRTSRFSKFQVPWLVSNGGWTEPRSIFSSHSHEEKSLEALYLHSFLDSEINMIFPIHVPGLHLLWLWAYGFPLWQCMIFSFLCGWSWIKG